MDGQCRVRKTEVSNGSRSTNLSEEPVPLTLSWHVINSSGTYCTLWLLSTEPLEKVLEARGYGAQDWSLFCLRTITVKLAICASEKESGSGLTALVEASTG